MLNKEFDEMVKQLVQLDAMLIDKYRKDSETEVPKVVIYCVSLMIEHLLKQLHSLYQTKK